MCHCLEKPCPARGSLISISDQNDQIHFDVHLKDLKIVTIKNDGKINHCNCHPDTNNQGNLPQHPWVLFYSKEKNSPP